MEDPLREPFELILKMITSNGGTGLTSYTAGDLLYYATGTALSALVLGTQGQVLKAGASAP